MPPCCQATAVQKRDEWVSLGYFSFSSSPSLPWYFCPLRSFCKSKPWGQWKSNLLLTTFIHGDLEHISPTELPTVVIKRRLLLTETCLSSMESVYSRFQVSSTKQQLDQELWTVLSWGEVFISLRWRELISVTKISFQNSFFWWWNV